MQKCLAMAVVCCLLMVLVPGRAAAAGPETSAKACVLMEMMTGEVLYASNPQEKRSVASTTKIMTALLTLESGDLDTQFPVDNDAIHVEGSSMGLQENDIVTRRALCYGMLLPSGNDAANAAAVSVAGSIPDFADRMNARAKEIGMTRTCFVTPSGLEAPGHGSSAYDMALLAREAMQNPDFRDICCQTEATVSFGDPPYERTLYNSNKLLKLCDGVIGIKTGFTDEAGRCLVSACERGGITLLCVTLGDPNDWQDHQRLYDYGFSLVSLTEPPLPENMTQTVVGGVETSVPLRAAQTVTVAARNGDASGISVRVLLPPFTYAPVSEGDVLGELVYVCQDREIASVPLLAAADAQMQPEQTGQSFWEKLLHRGNGE